MSLAPPETAARRSPPTQRDSPEPVETAREVLQITSNLSALEQVRAEDVQVVLERLPGGQSGQIALALALLRGLRGDYVLINCSPRHLFFAAGLKLLLPFSRARVVSLDTVLPVPRRSLGDRVALWVKKLLFRQVHLFIEYFKETGGYEQHYGIARHKFRYVPFKINRYERILATPTRDEGYIFCGGNTRRDFGTLIRAARGLPYPVRIVTMQDAIIQSSGSELDERNLPPNVQVVRHDGSDSFIDHIAAARMVVLPIRKENISASGVGVSLAAMALGKCVIMSEGPAVNGVIPEGAVVTVPPEDALALATAIRRAYSDDPYRDRVAAAGREYALGLKGDLRLCESVLAVLLADRTPSNSENS